MANTFILGGSPLGLIGVQSRPTRDGMSTFNGGKSRNVNVLAYNTGREQETNIKNKDGKVLKSGVSLFTGGSLPNFWPNIGKIGSDKEASIEKNSSINRDTLHNNDVYDTSVLNIIEKLSQCPKASLRPQDFAYLKDLGVYPNNRLMIARKFSTPQKDNILDKKGQAPLATIISWKATDKDFLTITYGEVWEDAEADFTNILNSMGEEFGIGGSGGGLGKALNVLPLPGFTESLQRDFLAALGVLTLKTTTDADGNVKKVTDLPAGDPNMIKKARQRKLVGYGTADSGLYCDVKIAMEAVYEQKFISGIDSTIAYMDILNNLVQFGTQKSSNYGLSTDFVKKLDSWTGPGGVGKLVNDVIAALSKAFTNIKTEMIGLIDGALDALAPPPNETAAEKKAREKAEADKTPEDRKKEKLEEGKTLLTGFIDKFSENIEATVKKYKVQIMGVANSLSGSPSTPWHITIGNPLRPVFCSGDMLTMRVKLELGKDLAFNDLPSTIKVSFDLENSRPWGLQEILAKFNTGHIRTVNVRKDFTVTDRAGELYTLPFEDDEFNEKEFNAERDNQQGQSSDGTTRTNNTTESDQSRTRPRSFGERLFGGGGGGFFGMFTTKANDNAGAKQNEQ